MQGFAIEHDKPFFYKKTFTIPADYAGKQIILRFDGVYSHAKLSVMVSLSVSIMVVLPVGKLILLRWYA